VNAPTGIDDVVLWSVCLSCLCPMTRPDWVKICLTSVIHFLSKFSPKVTHPVHLSVRCGRMVRDIVQWSQWRAYRKPPLLFQMVPSLTPYNLLFPQKLSPKCTQDKLSDACCHLVNMTEDIDKAAVCYARCHYELSDVTFCQIILALVLLG